MNIIPAHQTNIKKSTETLIIIISVVVSLLLLATTLASCRHGIDFTDEGFYLNSIANPWLYKSSVTQFGFIYHPLYLLVGSDVVLLRQINILITVALSFALLLVVIRQANPEFAISTKRHNDIYISSALSTSVLVILHNWLPTPSYNWLALQALLITGIGIALAGNAAHRATHLSPTMMALGGWLALMAKPTTAAALGLAVLAYLIITRRCRRQLLIPALGGAFALTFVSALAIDGSLPDFFMRLQNGAQDAALLAGGHTLREALRIGLFSLSESEKPLFWAIASIASVTIFLGFSDHTVSKTFRLAALALISLTTGLICMEFYFPTTGGSRFQGLLLAASIPFGVVFSCLVLMRGKFISFATSKAAALTALFASFPYVFAFGTNRNYWHTGADVAIFWIIAVIIMLSFLYRYRSTDIWANLSPIAVGAQLVATILIQSGVEHPYRQPLALRLQSNIVAIGVNGSSLMVAPSTANYLNALRSAARNNGFVPGTPIIDLTGHYPGAIFALGASPVGSAWMIGGYPGSAALAIAALNHVPCKTINQAWVLLEPQGPRHLPKNLLSRYGINLDINYKTAAHISSPDGEFPPEYEQLLLKPTPSTDMQAICKKDSYAIKNTSMKKNRGELTP